MNEILDKIVTGFFVAILGAVWYCSTKYYIRPNDYSIIIYDIFGKQVKINEIRTDFKTRKVAQNYISEYKKRFPHYDFSLAIEVPEIKRNTISRISKMIQR